MSERTAKRVVVIGLGYVGLPIAILAVSKGFEVWGIDTDVGRLEGLKRDRSPTTDIDSRTMRRARLTGRLYLGSDYGELPPFAVAVLTVPTPLKDGVPNLGHIIAAAEALAPHIQVGSTVILESTTYPGTTENLLAPILENGSGLRAGVDFFLGYSPERLDPGNQGWGLESTPKLVAGINEESFPRVEEFYSALGIPTVKVAGVKEAEMAKLIENTFRHTNIALINEIALFSEALGVDIMEAVRAAATKPFGFMPFWPGVGVGGHCLPIDTQYLSWAIELNSGASFRFGNLANEVNSAMPYFVFEKARKRLEAITGAPNQGRVLIIGLAYKKDTADLRESPSLQLCELFHSVGIDVYVADSQVSNEHLPDWVSPVTDLGDRKCHLGVVTVIHSDESDLSWLTKCEEILTTGPEPRGPNVHSIWDVAVEAKK